MAHARACALRCAWRPPRRLPGSCRILQGIQAASLCECSCCEPLVAGVIPWIPAIPRAALVPPIAPPCRSAALEAQLGLQGATGSLAGGVSLANRAGESCSLRGRVEVRFLD